MTYQVQWLGLAVAYLLGYSLWGYVAVTAIGIKKKSISSIVIIGFFTYHSVFQIVALPMILCKKTLTSLSGVWIWINIVMMVIALGIAVVRSGKKQSAFIKDVAFHIKGEWMVFVAIAVLIAMAYYTALQFYKGWDTAYYMGTLSTTMYTDTMYVYDGNSGLKCTQMDLRYALSTFYMHSAVIAKITGVQVLTVQRYVVASLCTILNGIVVYCIGKLVFDNSRQKAATLVCVNSVLAGYMVSLFSSSEFLFLRGYEAKGYCANVIMPAVLLCMLGIWIHNAESADDWKTLFIVAFASVAVSMSAILLVPAMICIMLLAHIIVTRKWKNILYGMICVVPNVVYLIIYFLFTKGLFVVGV